MTDKGSDAKRIYFQNVKELEADLNEQKKTQGDAWAGTTIYFVIAALVDIIQIPFVFLHNRRLKL